MPNETALIKLGGSVVTFKEKPLTANFEAINNIIRIIANLRNPLIIVHGGGSFGHYWSVKYDMHTKPDNYDPYGVSITHESMISLNQIIVNSMIRERINAYGFMPSTFTFGDRPIRKKIDELQNIAENGIIPVTFGDIIHIDKGKYSILSGDVIMTILAQALHPSKVIFTLNVDGIYKNNMTKEVIKEMKNTTKSSIELSTVEADVTGGMRRKVTEAFKIARSGIDVLMVNGLKPERIANAIAGSAFEGTIIKGEVKNEQNA
jgi:isopentenyl phosphate kinase